MSHHFWSRGAIFYVKYLLGQYHLENVKPTSSNDLVPFLSSSQLEKKPQKRVLANGLLSEWCLVSALENVCLLLGSYTPTGFTDGSGAVDSGREGDFVGSLQARFAADGRDSSTLVCLSTGL